VKLTAAERRSPRLRALDRFWRETKVEEMFPDERSRDYLRYAFLNGWNRCVERNRRLIKKAAKG
jgi:hypothetical protein